MTLQLSERALEILGKVKKLLALAADARGNEHQMAAAAAKAQELLEAYNLDMAMVGHTAKGAQRNDNRQKGGLYQWQRDLWKAVAEMNFCMYWSIKGFQKGQTYQHRILGRQENVIGAQVLADYLQSTIERLAQEEAKHREVNVFVREMIAYREGMATKLVYRLTEIRDAKLAAEAAEAKKQREAARQAGSTVTTNAVVLSTVISEERDLNNDFLCNLEPGTTAKRRAADEIRRATAMAAYEAELAAAAEYDRLHPEEAAARKARQAKERERQNKAWERQQSRRSGYRRERAQTPAEKRRDTAEFRQGYRKADEISLNQQIKDAKDTKRI